MAKTIRIHHFTRWMRCHQNSKIFHHLFLMTFISRCEFCCAVFCYAYFSLSLCFARYLPHLTFFSHLSAHLLISHTATLALITAAFFRCSPFLIETVSDTFFPVSLSVCVCSLSVFVHNLHIINAVCVWEREKRESAECGLSTQIKTKIVAFILRSVLLLLLSFMFHFLVTAIFFGG